jgi:hypothetical protein
VIGPSSWLGVRTSAMSRLFQRSTLAATLGVVTLIPTTAPQAQSRRADSLTTLLATPNIHVRAEAVARLTALPLRDLGVGTRKALIGLLEQEATGTAPTGGEVLGADDETYGEYVIDLTSAVLRFQDPSSLRGMARLGIETSPDAVQFVVSYGARSLPYLDEAWAYSESSQPSVIATWGAMLAARGTSALGPVDRERLLGKLLRAADNQPLAVARAASDASLVSFIPVLELIALRAGDDEIVRARALAAVATLKASRGRTSALTLVIQAQEWLETFCAQEGTSGQRRATCESLTNQLGVARGDLERGAIQPARNVLEDIARKAESAGTSGALSLYESRIISVGARFIISKLAGT